MIRLLSGDCRDVLATLPAESVQCVVTSPPYYGLRDYGTALWDGGDAACGHVAGNARNDVTPERLAERAAQYGTGTGNGSKVGAIQFREVCGRCGAVRVDRQIGLEATPEEYLATMVGVFREVRRVLRRDGVCWVNMGDSYNAGGNGKRLASPIDRSNAARVYGWRGSEIDGGRFVNAPGLAPKQLLLMPARLALALQADGWWVRSDIIWHKPNPMPESCTDRCTSAHEHVFMLTKASRYYFDAEAIRETAEYGRSGGSGAFRSSKYVGSTSYDNGADVMTAGAAIPGNGGSRNARSVWTIATHAYPEAHFATFPPELAERCIKAGTSERGCCAACGTPWVRVTERKDYGGRWKAGADAFVNDLGAGLRGADFYRDYQAPTTTGWSPGCQCNAPTQPCTVLDPFIGAGTTALVADRLQRDCIGIDLNVDYTRMAMDRCIADAPLFTSFAPAEDPEDERMADLFAGMAAD